MIYVTGNFQTIMADLHHKLLDAPPVDTGHWQSLKNVPHTATRELHNVVIETSIPATKGQAQWDIEPNLPWAEDHFQERVGGEPLNPGNQYMNWPWYRGGVEDHKQFKCPHCGLGMTGHQDKPSPCPGCGEELPAFNTEQAPFSHSYMERMWPRKAGDLQYGGPGFGTPENAHGLGMGLGVRYRLGDLNDVVQLLRDEPHTRQAYLPIWFPEDTGAHHGERVPCSLGYHFMLRDNKLHVSYFMRSLDFLRYLRDDVYMAMRLGQWVLEQVVPKYDPDMPDDGDLHWAKASMGTLLMTAASLHVFEGDMPKMRREAPATP